MLPTVVWYIRMSVLYFVAGGLIGLIMILFPDTPRHHDLYMAHIPVHAHLNLLGFMSMMVYGVGYHILPKFSGQEIYSARIMDIQFWLANAGLIGIAVSWPFVRMGDAVALFRPLLSISAACSLIAAFLFALNILKTVKPVHMPPVSR